MISKNKIAEYQKKAQEIVSQMTLEEKISQMVHYASAVERLNIKSYNWWNEALHGVARAGIATVFPQAIGMAATFDTDLVHEIGDAVSTEGRAKFNMFQKQNDHGIYKGLTFWAPNVNIFRDPRWDADMKPLAKIRILPDEWVSLISKEFRERIRDI